MIRPRKSPRPSKAMPAGGKRPRSLKLRLELLEDRRMLAAAADGLFGEQNIISADADKARSVFAADVDGDGDMDVLSASSGKIAWYENDGNEAFTAHTLSVVADSAFSVFAADVNGDDHIDEIEADLAADDEDALKAQQRDNGSS